MPDETKSSTKSATSAMTAYVSELKELKENSKPRIMLLTMLADENKHYASDIVFCIKDRLYNAEDEKKLLVIYLIDSIIKSQDIASYYVPLLSKEIDEIFAYAFSKSPEVNKTQLFKVRQTWSDSFPRPVLVSLDKKVNKMDPNWPVVGENPLPQTNECSRLSLLEKQIEELQRKKEEILRKEMESKLKASTSGTSVPDSTSESTSTFGSAVYNVKSLPCVPQEVVVTKNQKRMPQISSVSMSSTIDKEKEVKLVKKELDLLKLQSEGDKNTKNVSFRNQMATLQNKLDTIEKDLKGNRSSTIKSPSPERNNISTSITMKTTSSIVPQGHPFSEVTPTHMMAFNDTVSTSLASSNVTSVTKAPTASTGANTPACALPNGIRINPVSAEMINATRRVRDPRLLRRMETKSAVPPQQRASGENEVVSLKQDLSAAFDKKIKENVVITENVLADKLEKEETKKVPPKVALTDESRIFMTTIKRNPIKSCLKQTIPLTISDLPKSMATEPIKIKPYKMDKETRNYEKLLIAKKTEMKADKIDKKEVEKDKHEKIKAKLVEKYKFMKSKHDLKREYICDKFIKPVEEKLATGEVTTSQKESNDNQNESNCLPKEEDKKEIANDEKNNLPKKTNKREVDKNVRKASPKKQNKSEIDSNVRNVLSQNEANKGNIEANEKYALLRKESNGSEMGANVTSVFQKEPSKGDIEKSGLRKESNKSEVDSSAKVSLRKDQNKVQSCSKVNTVEGKIACPPPPTIKDVVKSKSSDANKLESKSRHILDSIREKMRVISASVSEDTAQKPKDVDFRISDASSVNKEHRALIANLLSREVSNLHKTSVIQEVSPIESAGVIKSPTRTEKVPAKSLKDKLTEKLNKSEELKASLTSKKSSLQDILQKLSRTQKSDIPTSNKGREASSDKKEVSPDAKIPFRIPKLSKTEKEEKSDVDDRLSHLVSQEKTEVCDENKSYTGIESIVENLANYLKEIESQPVAENIKTIIQLATEKLTAGRRLDSEFCANIMGQLTSGKNVEQPNRLSEIFANTVKKNEEMRAEENRKREKNATFENKSKKNKDPTSSEWSNLKKSVDPSTQLKATKDESQKNNNASSKSSENASSMRKHFKEREDFKSADIAAQKFEQPAKGRSSKEDIESLIFGSDSDEDDRTSKVLYYRRGAKLDDTRAEDSVVSETGSKSPLTGNRSKEPITVSNTSSVMRESSKSSDRRTTHMKPAQTSKERSHKRRHSDEKNLSESSRSSPAKSSRKLISPEKKKYKMDRDERSRCEKNNGDENSFGDIEMEPSANFASAEECKSPELIKDDRDFRQFAGDCKKKIDFEFSKIESSQKGDQKSNLSVVPDPFKITLPVTDAALEGEQKSELVKESSQLKTDEKSQGESMDKKLVPRPSSSVDETSKVAMDVDSRTFPIPISENSTKNVFGLATEVMDVDYRQFFCPIGADVSLIPAEENLKRKNSTETPLLEECSLDKRARMSDSEEIKSDVVENVSQRENETSQKGIEISRKESQLSRNESVVPPKESKCKESDSPCEEKMREENREGDVNMSSEIRSKDETTKVSDVKKIASSNTSETVVAEIKEIEKPKGVPENITKLIPRNVMLANEECVLKSIETKPSKDTYGDTQSDSDISPDSEEDEACDNKVKLPNPFRESHLDDLDTIMWHRRERFRLDVSHLERKRMPTSRSQTGNMPPIFPPPGHIPSPIIPTTTIPTPHIPTTSVPIIPVSSMPPTIIPTTSIPPRTMLPPPPFDVNKVKGEINWASSMPPPICRMPPSSMNINQPMIPPPLPPFQNFRTTIPPLLPPIIPLPSVEPRLVEMLDRDPVMELIIDNVTREIRFYDDVAVGFFGDNEPRELSFFSDARTIVINDRFRQPLIINGPSFDVQLTPDGKFHNFRLGRPTRELYIDGQWFRCLYGGPPLFPILDGLPCKVCVEGPLPKLKVDENKRLDLVLGKVKFVLDGKPYSVFLDGKPQKLVVDGLPLPIVIQFADSLRTLIINGCKFMAHFGGDFSQYFDVMGIRHFFSLSELPESVTPGAVNIKNMPQTNPASLPPPVPLPKIEIPDEKIQISKSPEERRSPPGPLSMPPIPNFKISVGDTVYDSTPEKEEIPAKVECKSEAPSTESLLGNINISELFEKLAAAGILSKETQALAAVEKEEKDLPLPRLDNYDSLIPKRSGEVLVLYDGDQCNMCGVRFTGEEQAIYTAHMDWHFRQKRKQRENIKAIRSRKWFYKVSDWAQFSILEGEDDRTQSWFETHQDGADVEDVSLVAESVPVLDDEGGTTCGICHDKFEQFYNEDTEQWHFENALRVNNAVYHPVCYGDKQKRDQEVIEVDDSEDHPTKDLEVSVTNAETEITVLERKSPSVELPRVKSPLLSAIDQSIEVKPDEATATIEPSPTVEEKSPTADPTTTSLPAGDVEMKDLNLKNDKLEESNVKIKIEKEDGVREFIGPLNLLSQEADISEEQNDEDDVEEVQLIEEPIEQIVIQDDVETPNLETLNLEEVIAEQSLDNTQMEHKDGPAVEEKIVDITHTTAECSIDGNVELEESTRTSAGVNKIKINISKGSADSKNKEPEKLDTDISIIELEGNTNPLKPKLVGRNLSSYPPVDKGLEASGLCCIM